METPLISVIVPVYNAQEYLAECIESILVQTLTAFELILVDVPPPTKHPRYVGTMPQATVE